MREFIICFSTDNFMGERYLKIYDNITEHFFLNQEGKKLRKN